MKQIIALLLLMLNSIAFAQNVSVTKSDIIKEKKKHTRLISALNDENGGLVTVRLYLKSLFNASKVGYYIEHFDADLKLIKTLDMEPEKDNYIKAALIKDNTLHLIRQQGILKGEDMSISVESAPLSSLEFGNSREILSFSKDEIHDLFGNNFFKFSIPNSQVDTNFVGDIQFSANKKFFVINFDFKDKKKETHKVFVFNDNFEPVFEKLIRKDIKDRLFKYNGITVDGTDGTIYFFGKSFENGKEWISKDGKTNYHFELIKVNANEEKTVSFKDDDKFISSMAIVKSEDKIACIGFYGNKREYRLNGVAAYYIDPHSLETMTKKFNPFSETFLNDRFGDKKNKKNVRKRKGLTISNSELPFIPRMEILK